MTSEQADQIIQLLQFSYNALCVIVFCVVGLWLQAHRRKS